MPKGPDRFEFLKEAIKEIGEGVATVGKLWRTEACEELGVRDWFSGEFDESEARVAFHDWLADRGEVWWRALVVASREAGEESLIPVLPRYGFLTEEPSKVAAAFGRMIRLRGLVSAVTGARAEIVWGKFECPKCGEVLTVSAEGAGVVVKENVRCPECNGTMIPTRDAVVGAVEMDLQEPPEKAGLEADRIRVLLRWPGYRHGYPQPGQRVEVVGTPTPKVNNAKIGEEGEVVIEAYAWFPLRREEETVDDSEAKGMTMEKVKSMIAPELVGYDRLRDLLVYQMISTDFDDLRGRIHVLLVGPPASGKSRMLQAVADLWGVYVSAEHVTGPGLTVAAERTKGGWVLKAGAAVAADGMVLAVDELDKASKDDVNHMLELMESGKVSVAKAGITTEIRTAPAVLAAANPKEQEINRIMTVIEDEEEELSREAIIAEVCGITPPLASRFDVVVPVRQVRDVEAVVKGLFSSIKKGSEKEDGMLAKARAWIRKARKVEPKIAASEEEVSKIIKEAKLPNDPRSVGSVIRIAVAAAKADYVDGKIGSPKVKTHHFKRAAELLSELSLDIKELEKVTEVIEKVKLSVGELRELVRKKAEELTNEKGEFTADELMEELESVVPKTQLNKARELFEDLKQQGEIMEREPGKFSYLG